MILDFHTHAFPDDLADRAIATLSEKAGIPYYHDGTLMGLRSSMKQAGITHAVVCNIAVKPGQTEKITEFATRIEAQERRRDGQHPTLIPFSSVHPFEKGAVEWLGKIKAKGFQGIKLHPDYQGFFVDDPRLEAFYREIARQDLIVVFHAGHDDGLPDPVHATPERIANVLPLLENDRTVLAHMGGNEMWGKVLELVCGRNVYLDTSYEFHRIDPQLLRDMFRKHTPERILFGTDSPWSDQSKAVDYFRDDFAPGFLSKEQAEQVLWSNGAALLGIE